MDFTINSDGTASDRNRRVWKQTRSYFAKTSGVEIFIRDICSDSQRWSADRGKKGSQDRRVNEGDQIEIDVDPSEISTPAGPDTTLKSIVRTDFFKRNFKILYEDNHLLACNKPSGLVVHPGTGHLHRDTLIELATGYLLENRSLKEGEEPALVHRLDRDTSGVILIAKNKQIVRKLHDIFRSRDIIKQYIAVCHHRPPEYEGKVSLEMARTHEKNSGTKMKVKQGGVR